MMTFIGQAVAYSDMVSCLEEAPPQSQFQQQMMELADMDHSQHMSMVFSNTTDSHSDCQTNCDCSFGGCSTVVASVGEQAFAPVHYSSATNYSSLSESQMSNSLYRPPISH